MTAKERIIKTLHDASTGLEQLKDDFFVFGSAAMVLAGLEIEQVNDIDISVSDKDAELLKEVWHNRNLNIIPAESTQFRSNLARYKFEEIDIEVSGDLQIMRNNKWQDFVIYDYETLPIGRLLVKIPTLYEQKNILHLFGREKDKERIKLIDKHITDMKNNNKN